METPKKLYPARHVEGSIKLPGSKSISNRTLLLAALSNGTTEIRDLLVSDDTNRMLEALQTLGIKLEKLSDTDWRVYGCAGNFPNKGSADAPVDLFLGNAGTAFRPLTAALALSNGHYYLHGVPRMHERPIGDLIDALRQIGCNIEYKGNAGFPPLLISPAKIDVSKPIQIRGDVSSQFLTALLMALPLTKQKAKIEVVGELISKPYVEITLKLMAKFGNHANHYDNWKTLLVEPTFDDRPAYVSDGFIHVEGDASSASYFLAAGAIAAKNGRSVEVIGVGSESIQGDVKFVDAIQQMGAVVKSSSLNSIEIATPDKLKAIDLDCNHIPDAAMTLAVMALFAEGTTTLRNIASWRVKETDRIAAMATELRKVGAVVEEGSDFIKITPPAKLTPNAVIDTYDDHRIAMCFSLVCLGEKGVPVTINDPSCVAKTFPDYFDKFRDICKVPVIAIDGPSASGKGTVAQRVAQTLGFHYLDSGALYRIIALAARRMGIDWQAGEQLVGLAKELHIEFKNDQVLLDGADISEAIRTEEIGRGASEVAIHPLLRSTLLNLQHSFRQAPGLVADGRDMASVVFTDAKLKIFLTASVEARAERRFKQLINKGLQADYATILADLQHRDLRDSGRSTSPLIQTKDAILLDTTARTINEAVQFVLNAHKKLQ